jgi:hypothetical protein
MLGTPVVRKKGKGWAVKVADHEGVLQEFRYSSEAQARFFAAVLALNPSVLPPGGTQVISRPRKRRVALAAPIELISPA